MSKLDDIIDEAGDVIDSYSAFTSYERPEIKLKIKTLMYNLLSESLKEITETDNFKASDLSTAISKRIGEL